MKQIVLKYGLISGGILAAVVALMAPLCGTDAMNFDYAEVFGYTTQVLAFLLVFFGIRSYRENVGAGSITFGKGLQVGLFVVLIAGACYVISWEIVYYNFLPDFGDKYAAHMIQKMEKKGASAPEIEAAKKEMARFKELYKNPFINVGMTFMEVLPVGLIVTLVSAAALRRKTPAAPSTAAVVAAS